jgi:excisionase family DNA binding protein
VTTAQAPLAEVFSIGIADAVNRTGISEPQLYRLIRAGRLRSFKLGKRRYIDGASLRELLAELTAETAAEARRGTPTPWRRGPGGRWVGRDRDDEDEANDHRGIVAKGDG